MNLERNRARGRLERRALRHQALADPYRLAIVDELTLSDRTPSELRELVGVSSNLLAFHLDVLEDAGLVTRHVSEGDRRRRYVSLDDEALAGVAPVATLRPDAAGERTVLFVCRRNSARSQLAAALWSAHTGREALSAGIDPAARVHPHAVEIARRHGLDLSGNRPRGYDEISDTPGLVVSVCDRAREDAPPFNAPLLHWSIADPADAGVRAFERAYAQLSHRVGRLAAVAA